MRKLRFGEKICFRVIFFRYLGLERVLVMDFVGVEKGGSFRKGIRFGVYFIEFVFKGFEV